MKNEIKRLYRSRNNRVVLGICGGLGEYFNIDPIIFRILFVLLFLADGIGFVLYIIMALIIPIKPRGDKKNETDLKSEVSEFTDKVVKKAGDFSDEIKFEEKLGDYKNILGAIVIFLGLFLLLRHHFNFYWVDTAILWPLSIVAVGFYIILKK